MLKWQIQGYPAAFPTPAGAARRRGAIHITISIRVPFGYVVTVSKQATATAGARTPRHRSLSLPQSNELRSPCVSVNMVVPFEGGIFKFRFLWARGGSTSGRVQFFVIVLEYRLMFELR